MTRTFDRKLFIILTAAFVLATMIGTLSHELGHYIVAKGLGYKASIHYAYTNTDDNEVSDSIDAIILQYPGPIRKGTSFPAKERYDQLIKKASQDELWIITGGPLQTMLTGTMGLFLLLIGKRSFKEKANLSSGQWILVLITLFWLRQTANLIVWLGVYLVTKKFSYRGDEIRIALMLHLPFWLLAAITGAIGLFVLYVVVFKFIPQQQRLTFVSSGIVGGVAGYVLWLCLLGPLLLP